MNFTYTVRQPPDKKFGSMDHQGQWNGMVGQLADDQSDIGKQIKHCDNRL